MARTNLSFLSLFVRTVTLGFIVTLTWRPDCTIAAKCPAKNDDHSCRCDPADFRGYTLWCALRTGQRQLTEFMTAVYAANSNLGSTLQVDAFSILFMSPNLTSLDLTPLTRCNISTLEIGGGQRLRRIVRFRGVNKMTVRAVSVSSSALTNREVTNLLSYIDPQSGPKELSVGYCPNFKNVKRGSLFIPQLTLYQKLKHLKLPRNGIKDVFRGAFKGLKSLTFIDLWGNQIKRLEKGAFEIGYDRLQTDLLMIDLSHNNLTVNNSRNSFQAGFLPRDDGLINYYLNIMDNNLEFLPRRVFEDLFRFEFPLYMMSFSDNPFICDHRMKWMKKIPSIWQPTVKYVDCTNDRGKTIFTTDLV